MIGKDDKVILVLQQGSPTEHKHLRDDFTFMNVLVANTEYHDLLNDFKDKY